MSLKKKQGLLVAVCALCALLYPVFFRSGYVLQFGINIIMYAMAAAAWNIIGGYAGQLALGNVYISVLALLSLQSFSYTMMSRPGSAC